MMDLSLGGPVDDCGDPPIVNGKPLHAGSCNDSVYGCTRCLSASRRLSDDDLKALGWETTGTCGGCSAVVHVRDLRLTSWWDEPSVKQELCGECRKKDAASLAAECNDDYRDVDYD